MSLPVHSSLNQSHPHSMRFRPAFLLCATDTRVTDLHNAAPDDAGDSARRHGSRVCFLLHLESPRLLTQLHCRFSGTIVELGKAVDHSKLAVGQNVVVYVPIRHISVAWIPIHPQRTSHILQEVWAVLSGNPEPMPGYQLCRTSALLAQNHRSSRQLRRASGAGVVAWPSSRSSMKTLYTSSRTTYLVSSPMQLTMRATK